MSLMNHTKPREQFCTCRCIEGGWINSCVVFVVSGVATSLIAVFVTQNVAFEPSMGLGWDTSLFLIVRDVGVVAKPFGSK